MPSSDVVVVGAGLAGMTAAIALSDAGARVVVVARGHAATHWTAGGFDVAAPGRVVTAADGLAQLTSQAGHPYAFLGEHVRPAVDWLRGVLAAENLIFAGDLDGPLRTVPTAIGGTRRVGLLPAAQAAALAPWSPEERLVVCGPTGFKDFWPTAIAESLARPAVWGRATVAGDRPARVDSLVVELPGLAGRRNLNALVLGRLFDDPAWRMAALAVIAGAIGRGVQAAGRIALPAVLGLADHAAAFEAASRELPLTPFEVPLVPPSLPGIRLYGALRAALRRRGGRIHIGEQVVRIETRGRRVTAVSTSAAARDREIRTGGLVLATGGIAGGGLVGRADGRLEEPLLGLPVQAPPVDAWLAADPFDPAGHPLEPAGIRTDSELHPVDDRGRVVFDNVAIVGSLLAGQRYLSERCGDGVAIASGRRAASVFVAGAAVPGSGRQEAGALT